jgi:hypothetical protein
MSTSSISRLSIIGTRRPTEVPFHPNERWSLGGTIGNFMRGRTLMPLQALFTLLPDSLNARLARLSQCKNLGYRQM